MIMKSNIFVYSDESKFEEATASVLKSVEAYAKGVGSPYCWTADPCERNEAMHFACTVYGDIDRIADATLETLKDEVAAWASESLAEMAPAPDGDGVTASGVTVLVDITYNGDGLVIALADDDGDNAYTMTIIGRK